MSAASSLTALSASVNAACTQYPPRIFEWRGKYLALHTAVIVVQMNDQADKEASGLGFPAPKADRLGALLLQLYDAANRLDLPAFQDQAISIVSDVIGFNGSLWGGGSRTASGYHVHSSHLHNLPEDTCHLLNNNIVENPMATMSANHPGKAFSFNAEVLYSRPDLAALSTHMGNFQSLCISVSEGGPVGALRFLVVTRGRDDPVYDESDKRWLELLNPHLNAALDLCCSVQMARWRRVHDEGRLLAISDARGFLYLSEPGLTDLLHEEWPDWSGQQLPDALVDILARGLAGLEGAQIFVECRWLGERALLAFRRRHAFDKLSLQERAVSAAFASGQSYKVVARSVGIAPATVRHHLRSVYLKLGISDKAALARLANSAP